jgi:hypothetical protein
VAQALQPAVSRIVSTLVLSIRPHSPVPAARDVPGSPIGASRARGNDFGRLVRCMNDDLFAVVVGNEQHPSADHNPTESSSKRCSVLDELRDVIGHLLALFSVAVVGLQWFALTPIGLVGMTILNTESLKFRNHPCRCQAPSGSWSAL